VLTKADKLPHGQRVRAQASRAGELALESHELLLTSCNTGMGLEELGLEIERQAGEAER